MIIVLLNVVIMVCSPPSLVFFFSPQRAEFWVSRWLGEFLAKGENRLDTRNSVSYKRRRKQEKRARLKAKLRLERQRNKELMPSKNWCLKHQRKHQ
jgi:hypothetical protein